MRQRFGEAALYEAATLLRTRCLMGEVRRG